MAYAWTEFEEWRLSADNCHVGKMKEKIHNLLAGAGTVLVLFPPRRRYPFGKKIVSRTDTEAFRLDMEKIAADMKVAMSSFDIVISNGRFKHSKPAEPRGKRIVLEGPKSIPANCYEI